MTKKSKKSKAVLCLTLFFIIANLLPVNAFGAGFFVTAKGGRGWFTVVNGDYTYTKNDDGNYFRVESVWWYWSGNFIRLEFDYASWWNLEYVLIDVWASDGQPKLYILYVNEQWTTIQIVLRNGYNAVSLDSNKIVEELRIVATYPQTLQVDYVGIYYTV